MRVVAHIAPDGTVTMKVTGVTGTSCLAATKKLQDALGSTVKDVKTSEYYAVPTGAERQRQTA
jgi:Protein of unknown function (DUF2997)